MMEKSASLMARQLLQILFFTVQGRIKLKMVSSNCDHRLCCHFHFVMHKIAFRYHYHFPFLDLDGLTVDDNRVGPLYNHVFPPKYAPNLSFVGLPVKVRI